MPNQADPPPPSGHWRARVATLLLLGAFLATSADSGTDPSASGPSRQPRHRERSLRIADAVLAREIQARGGRLIADYGGYQLLEVDPSLARQLSGTPGVDVRADDSLIFLNAGTIDTDSGDAQAQRTAASSFSGRRLHLVQLMGPVRPEWHAAIEETGVEIVTYVPNNAYLVYGDSLRMGRLRDLAGSAGFVRWDGPFQDEYKIDPRVRSQARASGSDVAQTGLFAIQMVRDGEANAATMSVVDSLRGGQVRSRFSMLNYENVIAELDGARLTLLAARPDVVSIQPYAVPQKTGERQDQIVAGNLSAGLPTGPGYLDFLSGKGFSQAQFTTSGFAVDVTDSGIDDGTASPNHFGLYVGGVLPGTSRVVYNRLEGTPHAGSTLQGCDGHGTINAHIVGGFSDRSGFPFEDASGYRHGLGVAPFVRLGSSVIFDPSTYTFPNLPNLQSRAYRDGARVSTNSWGASVNGAYTVDSQTFDALVRDAQPSSSAVPAAGNQQMVVVFAAGNDGPGSGTMGSPGTAKNVITVGASENVHPFGTDQCGAGDLDANLADDLAYFSSLGPTTDGRRKPDLVAPGTHVSGGVFQTDTPGTTGQAGPCFDGSGVCGGVGSGFLPAGQQFYTASSGTSHSTPAVAGGAALVRQHFLNHGWPAPSPAMTKAFLMSSTRYLAGSGTNDTLWSNAQGMGLMDLGRAFDGTDRVLRDQLPTDTFTASGQTRSLTGTITDASQPLRVTLAWTDAPGSTVGNAFRNDLDLVVTVGGATYRGNVFSGALSVAGGAADTRNNVESVFLPAGVTGNFVVIVTAANINSDGVPNSGGTLDQDFAIVVYNGVEAPVPVIAAAGSSLAAEGCGVGNGAIDPGETVTVLLSLANTGNGAATSVVGTLQASGSVTSPSGPQDYGTLVAGGPATTRPFTFTAAGTCGGTLQATLHLTDGGADLGTVHFDFGLGALVPGSSMSFGPSAGISIPGSGPATPYPSTINVSGLSGTVTKVTATLNGLSHQFADDVDILLVGPGGQTVFLMGDAGGGANLVNVTLTFDDDAALALPDGSPLPSGTYRPGNYLGSDNFPAPAPGPAYGSTLGVFNGTSPNGAWKLYVVDDFSGLSGSISGGWSLTIQTATSECCSGPSAGIAVTPTSGLVTTETGGAATFSVVLASTPSADVTIGLTSSDPTEGAVSPPSLTFTPADALAPKTVTVTGLDDTAVDGDVSYGIVTAPAVSTDPAYSGRDAADVSVTNLDDDVIGITVNPTSGLVTTEAGGTASFTIVLSSTPSADVTIAFTSSDTTEGTASPTSVTFTPANALVPQTVTVTGVDDAAFDGDIGYTVVTVSAVSADGSYDGLNPADVSVTNADNDTSEAVMWTNAVGVSALGNSLTKTAGTGWGTGGAISAQQLASGDGFVEITASEMTTNRMFGLGNGNTNANYTDIDFGFNVRPGAIIQVYEGGILRGTFGTYISGDKLRVAVEGGVVKYRKSGALLYTSLVAPTYPLLVDTALYTQNSTITSAVLSNWSVGALPTLSISDASVSEGNSGTVPAMFTVSLSAASAGTVTVDWATSNGTALADQDYVATSGTLIFTPGQTSQPIPVAVNGDTAYEPDETFTVTLSGPVGATIADGQGLGTITDDDATSVIEEPVMWTALVGVTATGNSLTKTATTAWGNGGAISVQQLASGEGYMEITASETTTNRMFGLSNGNSNASYTDVDFGLNLRPGGVIQVYEGGVLRGTFGTYATGDKLRVAVEGGVVRYRKNGTTLLYSSLVAPTYPLLVDTALYTQNSTITSAVLSSFSTLLSISDASVLEGNGGTTPMTFTASLSAASAGTVTVNWDTVDGTAVAGEDYLAGTGTLIFTPGQTSLLITVTVNGDITFEPDEALNVTLSTPSGAIITDGQGLGTITNDDTAVTVPVDWTAVVGVTATPTLNSLTKTATTTWGNAGAISVQQLAAGDGFVEITASETTTNRMFGLGNGNSNASYTDINFGLNLRPGATIQVYENGTLRGTFGTYAPGDLLRVAVEGGVVRYRKNGALLYTSGVAPAYPLLVDTALYTQNATITSAVVVFP